MTKEQIQENLDTLKRESNKILTNPNATPSQIKLAKNCLETHRRITNFRGKQKPGRARS